MPTLLVMGHIMTLHRQRGDVDNEDTAMITTNVQNLLQAFSFPTSDKLQLQYSIIILSTIIPSQIQCAAV